MHINEIIEWIDDAFDVSGPLADLDIEAIQKLLAGEGYQRYLQDQVNRHIIRDYLVNAVLLGVISESSLSGFGVQLASEETRAALALHMLMSSVDEAMELLPLGEKMEALTPLLSSNGDRPVFKVVPN